MRKKMIYDNLEASDTASDTVAIGINNKTSCLHRELRSDSGYMTKISNH